MAVLIEQKMSVVIETIDTPSDIVITCGARHPLHPAALVGRQVRTLSPPLIVCGLDSCEGLRRKPGRSGRGVGERLGAGLLARLEPAGIGQGGQEPVALRVRRRAARGHGSKWSVCGGLAVLRVSGVD